MNINGNEVNLSISKNSSNSSSGNLNDGPTSNNSLKTTNTKSDHQNCAFCESTLKSKPILNGVDADSDGKKIIHLLKCSNCDLIQSDRSMISSEFDERYFEGYYGETRPKRAGLLIRFFEAERKWRALGNRSSGTVLDVGCGDGSFLKSLSTSFRKFGFEPSKAGSDSLKKHGITAVTLDAKQDQLQGKIDVVTLWHSLEHVDHPKKTAESIFPFLSSNGEVYLSVPNFGSFQSILTGSKWFHLDPTRHLLHFKKKTLRNILESCGFKITSVDTWSFEYNVFGWWQSMLNIFPFKMNWAYKRIKRFEPLAPGLLEKIKWLTYLTIGIALLPIAFTLSILESFSGNGGVLNVRAKKK